MPLLDVSFMVEDPMLSDTFDVRRRLNIINNSGRVSALPDEVHSDIVGVVTQQDPTDLIRTEDGQTIPRRIFIATKFQMIAQAPDRQPDEVTWNGTVYTVVHAIPYSRYGSGFYEVLAEFRGPVPPLQ